MLNGTPHAVIWTSTPSGGYTVTRLGELPGTEASEAADINNQGHVVGYAQVEGEAVAVTWDSDGNPTLLLTPTGTTFAKATAINNEGEIVGTAQVADRSVAVLWTPPRGGDGYSVTVLDGLTGTRAHANDINDAGVIVGRASLANGQERAVVWTPVRGRGYAVTELCPLPEQTPAHTFSEASAINNRGQVAGRSIGRSGQGDQVQRPVSWDTR